MDEKALLAKAAVQGIAFAENGGKPNIDNPSAGKSGEMKSIFQYTPNTWHAVAAKYLGNANTPLNSDTETAATYKRVHDWVDKGYNIRQIASMWNAGEGRPNAYKENWKGTNSHGVSYDTPAYADKVASYAEQFYQKEQGQQGAPPQTGTSPTNQQQPNQGQQNPALQNLMSIINSAGKPAA